MLTTSPEFEANAHHALADAAAVALRASRVVGAWEDACGIEQTLGLGAHGPRRLHVALIDGDPAALAA